MSFDDCHKMLQKYIPVPVVALLSRWVFFSWLRYFDQAYEYEREATLTDEMYGYRFLQTMPRNSIFWPKAISLLPLHFSSSTYVVDRISVNKVDGCQWVTTGNGTRLSQVWMLQTYNKNISICFSPSRILKVNVKKSEQTWLLSYVLQ